MSATPVAASSAIISTPDRREPRVRFPQRRQRRLDVHSGLVSGAGRLSMLPLSTSIYPHMLTLSTCSAYDAFMARKRPNRYHHGDLSRSLLQEALRTIEKGGVAALTLRAVGEKLGVSRTALYRHFADKSALLAAVATEGFRTLRHRNAATPGTQQGGGREGFEAMGEAYVRFAVAHPSHYRVMFGGYVRRCGTRLGSCHGRGGGLSGAGRCDRVPAAARAGPARQPARAGAIYLGQRARHRDARDRRPAEAAD